MFENTHIYMNFNDSQKVHDMILELKVLVEEGWYQMICQTNYNGKLIRAFDAAQQMLEDLDRFMDKQDVIRPTRGEVLLQKEQKYRDMLVDKSNNIDKFFIRKDLVEELVDIHLLLLILTEVGWDETHENEEKDILEKACREKVDFALDRLEHIIRKIYPRSYINPEFIRYTYQWLSRIASQSEKYKERSKGFQKSAENTYTLCVQNAEEVQRNWDEIEENERKAGQVDDIKPLFPVSCFMH